MTMWTKWTESGQKIKYKQKYLDPFSLVMKIKCK